jgi:hypothetical protein
MQAGVVKNILFSAAALAATAGVSASQAACAPAASAHKEAVGAIVEMYLAATTDDLDQFHAATAPDFYAFDGGSRFEGDALMALIKKLHASGAKLRWSINEPQVRFSCDLAWITYVNRGSVETASGRQEKTWLESAAVGYDAGRWHVLFLQSTPVPKAP